MNIWVGPSYDVQALLLAAGAEGPSGIGTQSSGRCCSCVELCVRGSWHGLATVTSKLAMVPGPDDRGRYPGAGQ